MDEAKAQKLAMLQDLLVQADLQDLDEASDKELLEGQSKNQKLDYLKGLLEQADLQEADEAMRAREKLDWANRSAVGKARGIAAEVASGANSEALFAADLLTSPFRVVGEAITGEDVRSPSEVLGEVGIGKRVLPEGNLSEGLRTAGRLATVGTSLTGVQRAGSTMGDVMLDIAGFGSSTGTRAAEQARKTTEAIIKSDSVRLGNPEKWTDQQIVQEGQQVLDRMNIERNRISMDAYEKQMEDIAAGKLGYDEIIQPVHVGGIGSVVEQMAKIGVDPNRTIKAINKAGGLDFRQLDEYVDLDRQGFKGDGSGASIEKGGKAWYDRNFLPVADVIRKYADKRVGGIFERAIETNVRYNDVLAQRHTKALAPTVELVNGDRELKRLFLDLPKKPQNFKKISDIVERKLGPQNREAFERFMQDAREQNVRGMKTLFKDPDSLKDVYYLHTTKRVENARGIRGWLTKASNNASAETNSSLRRRIRKKAKDLTDEEVDSYVNPLLSHFKFMAEQDQLIRLSEGLGLRPSLSLKGKADDFFSEVQQAMLREGMDDMRASTAAGMMEAAFNGARKVPPPAIRAFMSLGYAGALAQFKSSMLNLHDNFVTAFRMGGKNAFNGALRSTMKSEFGKTLDELGMSSQGVGEFVRNFDDTLDNPSAMDKVSKLTQKYTDGAMAVSLFRTMDKVGKGGVLRSSVSRMREAAKNGSLSSEFSDIASRQELRIVMPHLKAGTKVKDMPPEAARIIEDMAFVDLGKQQLISYAGRPLNYLAYPLLRPAYAMTGFAIKQQALLRDMVGGAVKRGDYAQAGKILAGYAFWAGTGYGLLNEGRGYVFKNEEFEWEDVALGIVEQAGAAFTMNKLGDSYALKEIKRDGLGTFLLQSFLPPAIYFDTVGEDVITIIESLVDPSKDKVPDATLERVPALGDFYKYYYKKEERSD